MYLGWLAKTSLKSARSFSRQFKWLLYVKISLLQTKQNVMHRNLEALGQNYLYTAPFLLTSDQSIAQLPPRAHESTLRLTNDKRKPTTSWPVLEGERVSEANSYHATKGPGVFQEKWIESSQDGEYQIIKSPSSGHLLHPCGTCTKLCTPKALFQRALSEIQSPCHGHRTCNG